MEVVALDGFDGNKSATVEELPGAYQRMVTAYRDPAAPRARQR